MLLRQETLKKIAQFRQRKTVLLKAKQDLLASLALPEYSLQNTKVLENAKASLQQFTPAKLDIQKELKELKKQKETAVQNANQTQLLIKQELQELEQLLKDIQTARPIDQLTVDDIARAYPPLDSIVEKMAKRGQWKVPGYYEKFGEFAVGF
jgi:F-type H+-transporting ATPase subunit d